ncbi:Phosphoglycolate phosphatase 1A, chloroplastic [Castilleja foliolosa]|uniref:Phosphoglycolate phosphatase 1A, chloroplastic n=1 Tax=Castilleja foliolosa TaxID=1961234 RepID=A0ABD3B9C2_9LAMI
MGAKSNSDVSPETLTRYCLATKLSAASSSATLFFDTPNKFHLAKKIPSIANPFSCNSLRPILEWSFSKKICSRKMFVSRNAGPRASAEQLKDPDHLIDSTETFIFDCDGVIWKGDKLIDGVPETLDLLRSKGKRLVFVTNNSTKSRKQYRKKFETLGLDVKEEEIFASSFAAAAYLQSIDFPKHKKLLRNGVKLLKNDVSYGYRFFHLVFSSAHSATVAQINIIDDVPEDWGRPAQFSGLRIGFFC